LLPKPQAEAAVEAINNVDAIAARKIVKPLYRFISALYDDPPKLKAGYRRDDEDEYDHPRFDDYSSPFAGREGLELTVGFIEGFKHILASQGFVTLAWRSSSACIAEHTITYENRYRKIFEESKHLYG